MTFLRAFHASLSLLELAAQGEQKGLVSLGFLLNAAGCERDWRKENHLLGAKIVVGMASCLMSLIRSVGTGGR